MDNIVSSKLKKLIDVDRPKLTEVDHIMWKKLQARPSLNQSKEKSAQMRTIFKEMGSKEIQMRAIEKTIIGELVRLTDFVLFIMSMFISCCSMGCLLVLY